MTVRTEPLQVLLLDPNPADVQLARTFLDSTGDFVLAVAESLAAAREVLLGSDPACILTEIRLPDSDGVAVINELRTAAPDAALIVCTDLNDDELALATIEAGAQDYLVKGEHTGDSLARRIRFATERQQRASADRLADTTTFEFLRILLEDFPLPAAAVDAAGLVRVWNHASADLYGWAASEIYGKPLPNLPDREAALMFDEQMAAESATSPLRQREVVRMARSGELLQVAVTTAPVTAPGGEKIGLMAFSADLSEHKAAEEKLRQSEERFRGVFEHSHDAIFVVDVAADRIIDFNQKAVELLDYSNEEMTRMRPSDIHPDEIADFRAFGDLVALRGQGTTDGLTCRTASGRRLPCEISASSVEISGTTLMVAMIRDLTARRATDAALAETRGELDQRADRLDHTERELQDLTRALSHDLSEPARTVASYIQLLSSRYEDRFDGEAGEFMGFIVDASKRMRTYITDLSTYSRIGTGNLVTEQIEVSELVDGVVRSLGTAIEEANAEVTVGDLPRVVGNRAELEQVFTNLLSNAVKFVSGENQPQIRISASPSEPGWQFSIADNGIGIDPRHADRIYEMFKRLHGPADYPGSGMGLALCRKVIERHGGSLWVESGSGDGSVFYFTIANQ